MQSLHCLCCRKRPSFIAVEPNFYCDICVRKKEIHNSEGSIKPIKWYHNIEWKTKEVQISIEKRISQIKDIAENDKIGAMQLIKERIAHVRGIVDHLRMLRNDKINIKNSVIRKRLEVEKVILRKVSLIKDTSRESNLRNELLRKTKDIQIYLNEIQWHYVNEMLTLLPIQYSKFGHDSVAGLPISIKLSEFILEPNDQTASAILVLVILSTSISFVLDLHFSSMNIREFTVETLCRLNQPLKRDEIMSVYEMVVKLVHHIIQATLLRVDVNRTLGSGTSLSTYSSFSVQNYPVHNLSLLKENLKKALIMKNLSNPYILHLPSMFVNPRLDDFSNSARADRLNGLSHDTNSLDFVEISSNVPFDDSSYERNSHVDVCDSGSSTWFKFQWIKKPFM